MIGSFSGALATLAMLLFFQVCGVTLARVLLPQEGPAPRLLLGSVFGSVLLQWLPALLAFFLGFTLNAHLLAILLASLLTAGAVILARKHNRLAPFSLRQLSGVLGHSSLVAVLALWLFFCFLVLHSFRWADGRIYSSQATFGDMAMHLSFITSLARQGTFPPNYSLLPGVRLSYPFLSDSISSSLYLVGGDLRLAYCLPMFLAGAQVMFGGWLLFRALMGRRQRGFLAWLLFFFNGGLGLLYFFHAGGLSRIFTGFYQTPTNLSEKNVRWVNVVVDMLLPQRATLFGWAVLFPALYLLCRAVFAQKRSLFPVIGLLAGALPMIHTHSFLALALVCGVWLTVELCRTHQLSQRAVRLGKFLLPAGLVLMTALQYILTRSGLENSSGLLIFVCGALCLWAGFVITLLVMDFTAGKGRPWLMSWGLLLGITLLLAVPQLLTWTFQQVSTGSMLRGHFGWITGEDNYLWFYLKNLGFTAPLAFFGLLTAKPEAFARYCPALAIWFLAEFVEFQPNDYDNNKLLYVGFLFLCCAAADGLCSLLERVRDQRAKLWSAGAAMVVLTSSALLTMGREAVASYELFGDGALSLCQYIEENLEPSAIVLTDQRHNNEVASLSGRSVVCGSPSYLFYHGLPYTGNEEAARKMYEEPEASRELFIRLGVDYVLVSDFERSSFTVDTDALEQMFPRVFDDGCRVLYQVEGFSGEGSSGKGDTP